jgi:hypothetical protein
MTVSIVRGRWSLKVSAAGCCRLWFVLVGD